MRKFYFLLLAALLVGCSQKPDAMTDTGNGGPDTATAAIEAKKEWEEFKKPKGETAPQVNPVAERYKAMLWDKNLTTQEEGKLKLRSLGEASYPVFREGMVQQDRPDVRLASLQGIYKKQLVTHEGETMPILINLLDDKDHSAVRETACVRLSEYGGIPKDRKDRAEIFQRLKDLKVIDKLRAIADNLEEEVPVRQAALDSARVLHWAMTDKRLECEEKIRKGEKVRALAPH